MKTMNEKEAFIKQLLNKYFNTDDVAKVAADVVTNSMDDQERTELISLVIYEHFKKYAEDLAKSDPLYQIKEYNGLTISPKKKHPLENSPKINIVDCINRKYTPMEEFCKNIEFVKSFDEDDEKYNCINLFEMYLKNSNNFNDISFQSGGINPYDKDANCMTLTFYVKEGEYIPYDEILILKDYLEIESYGIFLKDAYSNGVMGKVHHIKHFGTGERLDLTILPVHVGDIKYETVKLDRNDGKVIPLNKNKETKKDDQQVMIFDTADAYISHNNFELKPTFDVSDQAAQTLRDINMRIDSIKNHGVNSLDQRIFEVNILIKPTDNYVDLIRGIAELQHSNPHDDLLDYQNISVYWKRMSMNDGNETQYEYCDSRIYELSEEKTVIGTIVRIMITTNESKKIKLVDDKYNLKD